MSTTTVDDPTVIAQDKVGNDLRVGDRVIYDAGIGEWQFTTGRIVGKAAGSLIRIVVDAEKQDGSPHPHADEYATDDHPAELNSNYMTRLKDEGPFPLGALVRWKTVPQAYGIVTGFEDGEVMVLRVHEHFEMGTQTDAPDRLEVVPLDERPQIAAKNGTVTLGQRVRYANSGDEGTIVGKSGDGYAAFLTDEEVKGGVKAIHPSTVVSPGSDVEDVYEFLPPIAPLDERKQVGTDLDGKPVYVGDVLEYVQGSGHWIGAKFEVLDADHGDNLEFLEVPSGLSHDYSVGGQVHLTFSQSCRLVPHLKGTISEQPAIPNRHYPDGTPICEGDRVVFVNDIAGIRGKKATVLAAANSTALDVEPDDSTMTARRWSQSYIAKVGTPTGFEYDDGNPILLGDDVVVNPGEVSAGKAGVVIGYESSYVKVQFESETGLWSASKLSRLQDPDKEKLADDVKPETTAATEKVTELLERIDSLKEDLESKVSEIESELSEAEGGTPSYTVDEDSVRSAVSVSTSNSELLSLISYDGSGELSIDDARVDEHAQETLNVNTDEIEVTFDGEQTLSSLHSAFASGQEKVNELLETVEELRSTVKQALAGGVVPEVQVPSTERLTFEGIIRNARFGSVLPEDAETGPALRFDVVDENEQSVSAVDSSGTKPTRRVRLVGKQIGNFLAAVAVSDVKLLEGRKAILQEDDLGGFWPTAVGEVPTE